MQQFTPSFAAQVSNVVLESNITGLELRTQQNDINAAFNTLHKGASLPASAAAGTLWIDDSGGATAWLLKQYDGTDSITIGTINTSANTFTPSGQLGTFGNAVVSKTGTHTLDSTHYGQLIKADATSASFTSNIAAASTLGSSWYAIIQKIDATANTITIDPNSTEQVNGAATYVLKNQYEGIILVKDSSSFRALPFGNTNLVKVSSDDTTAGYIEDKITAGNGISLATANSGANENRAISTNLATDSGLEFSGSALRAKAGTGIVRSSTGINVDVGTTANKIVQLNGSAQLPAVSGALLTNLPATIVLQQIFTSSGTYTPTAGMDYCIIEVVGGGGGGGGAVPSGVAGGGGAGGYGRARFTAATIGGSQAVTIGSAGAGGTSFGTDGTAGGTSSFGALISATGGGGGYGFLGGSTSGGGIGGASSGADINISGGGGGYSMGGTSFFGGGARYVVNANGASGAAYGSGGSGGSSIGGSSYSGGAGKAGVVIITEFVTP